MRAKPYFLTVLVRTEEESGLVGDEIFVPVRAGPGENTDSRQ